MYTLHPKTLPPGFYRLSKIIQTSVYVLAAACGAQGGWLSLISTASVLYQTSFLSISDSASHRSVFYSGVFLAARFILYLFGFPSPTYNADEDWVWRYFEVPFRQYSIQAAVVALLISSEWSSNIFFLLQKESKVIFLRLPLFTTIHNSKQSIFIQISFLFFSLRSCSRLPPHRHQAHPPSIPKRGTTRHLHTISSHLCHPQRLHRHLMDSNFPMGHQWQPLPLLCCVHSSNSHCRSLLLLWCCMVFISAAHI